MKTVEAQLKELAKIVPAAEWRERTRGVLQIQIAAGAETEQPGFFAVLDNLVPAWVSGLASKPVAVFAGILLAVLSGSYASVRAARETKPGDSLYIAKIISEKTQQALTFDEAEKAKLNLEFATNRVEELAKVLDAPAAGQSSAAASLRSDAANELSQAKSRLAKINQAAPAAGAPKKTESAALADPANNNDDKVQVFGATLSKDGSGLQVIEPSKALAEAKALIDQADYHGTVTKIDEASKLLATGETPAPATTTPKEEASGTSTKK